MSKHTKAQLFRFLRLAAVTLVAGGGADLLINNVGARLGLSAAVVGILETTFRQAFKVAPTQPTADPADTASLP